MTLYQYRLRQAHCVYICECDRMSHLIIYNTPKIIFIFAHSRYIEGDYLKRKLGYVFMVCITITTSEGCEIHAKMAQEKAGCRCYVMLFILIRAIYTRIDTYMNT